MSRPRQRPDETDEDFAERAAAIAAKRNANLKPAKKGEIRNPKGRPKKLPQLDALLRELFGENADGSSGAREVILTLKKAATSGKMSAMRVMAAEKIVDRLYGKIPEKLTVRVGPMEVIANDKKAREIFERYKLPDRAAPKVIDVTPEPADEMESDAH